MKLLPTHRRFGTAFGRKLSNTVSDLPELPAAPSDLVPSVDSPLLKAVGWVSAGVGALAIGVIVGREIRQRYKFKRRTPYDMYAHSGDAYDNGFDFGLGI